MARRGVWMAAVAGLSLVAAGCGDDGTDQAGASTVFRLQAGECFNSPAVSAGRTVEVEDVTPVPCADPHDAEVFAVLAYPAGHDAGYPGDEVVADHARTECLLQFPGYTGGAYDDADVEMATIRPDQDSWEDKDDRQIACVLYQQGSTLTGSRRKA